MKCPVCRAEIPATAKFCGGCGATITQAVPPRPIAPAREPVTAAEIADRPAAASVSPTYPDSPAPRLETKYKALRLIAKLYKVLAFVAGGGCVVLALFLIASSFISSSHSTAPLGPDPTSIFSGAVGGLMLLIYGAFLFIFLYGLGEWMYVFMDIEENTRKTNEMLASRPQAGS